MKPSSGHVQIKVVGIGGAGTNAVNRVIRSGLNGVQFLAVNTDEAALKLSQAKTKLLIGRSLTRGKGSGANIEIGRRAALADAERISNEIAGMDIVFLVSGLGGGTGGGATPIFARIARERGALTIGIVTMPFEFEGNRRLNQAREALSELASVCHVTLVIPNEGVMQTVEPSTSFFEAFRVSDQIVSLAVGSLVQVATLRKGLESNLEYMRAKLSSNRPFGAIAVGTSAGVGELSETRLTEAVEQALSSRLISGSSCEDATSIIVNLIGDYGPMDESGAAEIVKRLVGNRSEMVTVLRSEDSGSALRVVLILLGLSNSPIKLSERKKVGTYREQHSPDILVFWDPQTVSEAEYTGLIGALGDLVRSGGGLGINREKALGSTMRVPEPVKV